MQKKFCGGEACAILLRKVDAHSALIGVRPSLPEKIDDRGHFYYHSKP